MSCNDPAGANDKPSGGNTDKPVDDPYALVDGGETVASILPVECRKVARVIGVTPSGESLPNPNNSMVRFGMASTDFGNMWDAGNGSVFCIFGDNFNATGGDWLSNAIAISTDRKLTDGLYYDSMLWSNAKNKRMEIVNSGEDPEFPDEVTCIPTNGFSVMGSVGRRQYFSYMSIKQWDLGGVADSWACNYSQLVYSDDFGKTWKRSGVKWDGDGNFVQCAFSVQGSWLYMWGTPAGRFGKVHVARVSTSKILDKSAYEYWDGGAWVADESKAVPVTNGTVSEFSVQYNSYYKRYMMLYLSVNQRKLVFRDAASPEGEWSAEKPLLSGTYGPSIHPWFCDGRDLWFVSSSVTSGTGYNTWHIFLYQAKLKADEDGFNMIWEPGFEDDPGESISYKTLWEVDPGCTTSHVAHSGICSCRLSNTVSGQWKDACTQEVSIHENTDYVLTGWARASVAGYSEAHLGVRLPDGTVIDSHPALSKDDWTRIRVEFNSGANTSLSAFFGTWGSSGLYVMIDDMKLTPKEYETE